MTDQLTEIQQEAMDRLFEEGGEDRWIEASDFAHHMTIKALEKKRLIQVEEFDGDKYLAVAGRVIKEEPEVVLEDSTGEA